MDNIFLPWTIHTKILRQQLADLSTLTDHDFCLEGKPGCDFIPHHSSADRFSDHKGAGSSDVDDIQMLKVFGEQTGSEAPVAANVQTSQKDDERQEIPPVMTSTGNDFQQVR